ncbi:MAG: response regulator transcription factor [Blautia sp.]|nr:response regulator transcription factor [Eubacteriales bacterium]MED9966332.1 response regulator transcription factor [Blautia sp.]
MKKILIIDDDVYIGDMLEEILTKEGYAVARAYSGTEALLCISGEKPDLVLLDLMLPGLKGEEVLPRIKGIPVIVVSARTGIEDKVDLLMGGAADYVTKPFDTKELLARIAVQFRKASGAGENKVLTFGELSLHMDTHEAEINGKEIRLTRTEFAILKLLMMNPAQVITKSLLLERISEDTPDCTENSLKMHISNLRKKLRDIGEKEYIASVWGIGFQMKAE